VTHECDGQQDGRTDFPGANRFAHIRNAVWSKIVNDESNNITGILMQLFSDTSAVKHRI